MQVGARRDHHRSPQNLASRADDAGRGALAVRSCKQEACRPATKHVRAAIHSAHPAECLRNLCSAVIVAEECRLRVSPQALCVAVDPLNGLQRRRMRASHDDAIQHEALQFVRELVLLVGHVQRVKRWALRSTEGS